MKGTLRRKSVDTWQLRVFHGYDDKGKQLCDYHTIHARTKRDAEAEQRRILHTLDTGGYLEPSRLTVAEYLESWLREYAALHLKPYTLERYECIVRKHLIPALGSIRMNQLAPMRIERYYAEALKSGRLVRARKSQKKPPEPLQGDLAGLDAQTVVKHHRVLHGALKRAVRLGLLVANPCDRVTPPKASHTEMRVLDEMDTERLLASAKASEPLSLYALVLLAVNLGLRRGEALGLRWSDVDLEHGVLQVGRSLQVSRSKPVFGETKTSGSMRRLSLDDYTVSELRSYRARQSELRLSLGSGWTDGNLVCPAMSGEPWHPNAASRDFRSLRDKCDLSIKLQELRHTHASQLIKAGAPAKVIQERLGHSSAGFTLTQYGHLLPGVQDEAVARLAEARAEARRKLASEG